MADSSASKRAVIVGLLGIGCYPLSWLGAALGVRALLAEKEAGPRRTLAIVAMLMPGLLLPVVALERAVFREPLRNWWVGRAQAECVENLPKLWAAEEKALEHNGRYTEQKAELDFKPPDGHHYTYLIGANAYLTKSEAASMGHIADADRLGIDFGFSGKTFKVGCVTRQNNWVDVWSVSNDDRPLDGGLLQSGKPYNEFSGVLVPRDGGQ